MKVKKSDFIEIEFTGKIRDTKDVFDTTYEDVAKKAKIWSRDMEYGPVIICVGERMILPGLDKALEDAAPGKHDILLPPESAFGKKTAELIQLIPTSKFTKEGIRPMPGLQINADGALGVVKTVTGGRTLVDFNHPLAGKEIVYEIEIKRKVENPKEQAQAILSRVFKFKKLDIEVKDDSLAINLPGDLPEDLQAAIRDKISGLTSLKNVIFKTKKEAEPTQKV